MSIKVMVAVSFAVLLAVGAASPASNYVSTSGIKSSLGDYTVRHKDNIVRLRISGKADDFDPLSDSPSQVVASDSEDEYIFDKKDVRVSGKSYVIDGLFRWRSGGEHQGVISLSFKRIGS